MTLIEEVDRLLTDDSNSAHGASHERPRVLVPTAEDGPGIERRVLELGADDDILKPLDPAIWLSRVNAVFRRLKVMAA